MKRPSRQTHAFCRSSRALTISMPDRSAICGASSAYRNGGNGSPLTTWIRLHRMHRHGHRQIHRKPSAKSRNPWIYFARRSEFLSGVAGFLTLPIRELTSSVPRSSRSCTKSGRRRALALRSRAIPGRGCDEPTCVIESLVPALRTFEGALGAGNPAFYEKFHSSDCGGAAQFHEGGAPLS